MVIIKNWQYDKRYTSLYWSQANNKNEYLFLIKDLFNKHKSLNNFSCFQQEEYKHLFNDDKESWHRFFQSDEYLDENIEFYSDPKKYPGNIQEQPKLKDYPCILLYCDSDNTRMITWYKL